MTLPYLALKYTTSCDGVLCFVVYKAHNNKGQYNTIQDLFSLPRFRVRAFGKLHSGISGLVFRDQGHRALQDPRKRAPKEQTHLKP